MTDQPPRHAVLEKVHRISQKLKLTCRLCGDKASYDVGRILCDREAEGGSAEPRYAFSNYFRCRQCGSSGPWDIADLLKVMGLMLRAQVDRGFEGLAFGRLALFDGTAIQAPAMGEEHLLGRIREDPRNGFLCSRLGNLLRNCGQEELAAHWHGKALELDPDDIESRHHLFDAAVQKGDIPSALPQALLLARSLLGGHKTDNYKLNQDIALCLAQDLRHSAEQFRAGLTAGPQPTHNPKEELFIRTLLAQTGDEQEIVQDAAVRLLNGKPAPDPADDTALGADDPLLPAADLVPALRALVEKEGLNPESLTVALQQDDHGKTIIQDRHCIFFSDGTKAALWQAPNLQDLFRGNRTPPADMDHYPEAYTPYFFYLEEHVLALCDNMGDRTDQEMEEIYSMLRRRPDGRSLGLTHDFMWQAAALLLSTQPLSAAEFEALIGALERSTRKWGLRPVSRNYAAYLHGSIEGAPE